MDQNILSYLSESLELSPEDANELFVMYLDTLDDHCDRMAAAIDKGDFSEIRALTHSLVGCSGNIGAEAVVEIVRRMNSAARNLDLSGVRLVYNDLRQCAVDMRAS